MSREAHVRFWERAGVQSPRATRLPLNRQSDVYEREGIDLDVSTLADWVGAAAATLMPLINVIRTHVFAAERIHADDTTVPVLAKGATGSKFKGLLSSLAALAAAISGN